MKFVSRAQWGALAPKSDWTYVASTSGVKIHYEGTHVPTGLAVDHTRCAGHVAGIQRSHLADTAEGYIDIAYSALVCYHGYVFEGRGAHRLNGANGGSALNRNHYAVCAILGDSGLTHPSEAMLHGLRDAVGWLRSDGGAGAEIKGHRDGYATSCPGGPLYQWVQQGAPRPTGTDMPEETDMPDDATLRRMIREETAAAVSSIPVRDAVAYAVRNYVGDGHPSISDQLAAVPDKYAVAHEVLYWMNQAMSGEPESAGDHPLGHVVPQMAGKFLAQSAELAAVNAALHTVLEAAEGIDTEAVKAAITEAVAALDISVKVSGS